jgi:hypothetical protein
MPIRSTPDIPKYYVSKEDVDRLIELTIKKHRLEHKMIKKII